MDRLRPFLLIVLALVAACSQRGMINRLSSDEDRAFAAAFVERLRSGDQARLESMFRPGDWVQSQPLLSQARAAFPPRGGNTELIGYHTNRTLAAGGWTTTNDYVLMTNDGRRWTRTQLRTVAFGDNPQRIVGWYVTPTNSMPDDYRTFLKMEARVPWLQAAGAVIIAAFLALLFWLVRRNRRRRAASQIPA